MIEYFIGINVKILEAFIAGEKAVSKYFWWIALDPNPLLSLKIHVSHLSLFHSSYKLEVAHQLICPEKKNPNQNVKSSKQKRNLYNLLIKDLINLFTFNITQFQSFFVGPNAINPTSNLNPIFFFFIIVYISSHHTFL